MTFFYSIIKINLNLQSLMLHSDNFKSISTEDHLCLSKSIFKELFNQNGWSVIKHIDQQMNNSEIKVIIAERINVLVSGLIKGIDVISYKITHSEETKVQDLQIRCGMTLLGSNFIEFLWELDLM